MLTSSYGIVGHHLISQLKIRTAPSTPVSVLLHLMARALHPTWSPQKRRTAISKSTYPHNLPTLNSLYPERRRTVQPISHSTHRMKAASACAPPRRSWSGSQTRKIQAGCNAKGVWIIRRHGAVDLRSSKAKHTGKLGMRRDWDGQLLGWSKSPRQTRL